MEQYDALLKLVEDSKKDFEAFYNKNNQAAGTRVRSWMQNIKNKSQEIRLEVQDLKNKE
jgi:hypothetical protein